jgi:hypothetical protein
MLTILAVLEKGYESSFEHLAFRQLKAAYGCGLVCVPKDFPTLGDALEKTPGKKVFLLPPGRVDSEEFDDFELPDGDVVFVFGSPQETLAGYVGDNVALHITTPGQADMMAVCVAAQVLYGYG